LLHDAGQLHFVNLHHLLLPGRMRAIGINLGTELLDPLVDQHQKGGIIGGIEKNLLVAVAMQCYVVNGAGEMQFGLACHGHLSQKIKLQACP